VTWSADDEETWKREKAEARLKHDRQMATNQKIADDQAMKKKACLEAKAAYENDVLSARVIAVNIAKISFGFFQ
jgi:hypothetical protein